MFCFQGQPDRKTRSSKGNTGLIHDFSQSVSALNQLSVPNSPACMSSMCHSDSNISNIQSFSFFKSAGKIKSLLSCNGSKKHLSDTPAKSLDCVVDVTNECQSLPPFGAQVNLSYIDCETLSLCNDVFETQPKSEELPLDRSNLVIRKRISSSPPLDLPLLPTSPLRADEEAYRSSSGNSSSSDVIAPMASPEHVTPPESGVSSPVHSAMSMAGRVPPVRYKLVHEGDIQVCWLNHTRTIVSKVLSSKFLRRWETHHVYLGETHVSSKTPTGFLEQPIAYTQIEEVYVVQRWDVGNKFCIRMVIPDGSLLFQAHSAFVRDQWLHSILWKRNMHKFTSILRKSSRPEVILKEIRNVVDFALTSPVSDEAALSSPISLVSSLLLDNELWIDRGRREEVILALAPLIADTSPTSEMCQFFSNHCTFHPRSPVVAQVFTPIVHRILKRNVDFGKAPCMRRFVADFVTALHSQNNGDEAISSFVQGIHGSSCSCPHPRVLPNLVAATFAAIFSHFEERRSLEVTPCNETENDRSQAVNLFDKQLQCYTTLFHAISELEDWRPGLAALLQPVPFPDDALSHVGLTDGLAGVLHSIGTDPRCHVHSMVLCVRPGKNSWLQVYCPSTPSCTDGGVLWCQILDTLMRCCCRRKGFLLEMVKQLGALVLMALRDQDVAQDMLGLMLEWRLLYTEEQQLQVVSALQSTERGKDKYREMCKRQDHLHELQQKGGPRKLTLPSRSTDADLAKLLSSGCFGNLECLSLAFTHVTSACADLLIQLPSIRYLNLWATQFGDSGLQVIADHLDKLQVLNLCETPVSDKGILALTGMSSLKKLNLNSTKLSVETLNRLKASLPELHELDVRYTDAW